MTEFSFERYVKVQAYLKEVAPEILLPLFDEVERLDSEAVSSMSPPDGLIIYDKGSDVFLMGLMSVWVDVPEDAEIQKKWTLEAAKDVAKDVIAFTNWAKLKYKKKNINRYD